MEKFFCKDFLFSGISAGLKPNNEKDLGLIFSKVKASSAAVFTKNIVKGAPLILNMKRIKSGAAQAVIVNSKNANCLTGDEGILHAEKMAKKTAESLNIKDDDVLVASTGVIGEPLPIEKISAAVPKLVENLKPSGAEDFARAIMTTDTMPKIVSKNVKISGKTFSIVGFAKGSGMIKPNMATMLCFVCTDIEAEKDDLQKILSKTAEISFNKITIDGDTSTNDMIIALANGRSSLSIKEPSVKEAFEKNFKKVLIKLAKMIVKDGEGATKFVEIRTIGALTEENARKISDTIANSNLVKTAFFGEDANWGRIAAAAGRAGINFDPENIKIFFDDVMLVKNGKICGKEAEKKASDILKSKEFVITIDINTGGKKEYSVYTCDFSIDYVKINADYRT
jgi:glutamate N-acetyltransferase / amino-acid N-acetyltransferase